MAVSEKALRQMAGCPTQCPLVKDKPCDPDAIYTKLKGNLPARPEAKGFKYLCAPCEKLVQRIEDEERKLEREAANAGRDAELALRALAKEAALEAEAKLRSVYEKATMVRSDTLKAVKAFDEEQTKLEQQMGALEAQEAQIQKTMLSLRQKKVKVGKLADELEERIDAMGAGPDPVALGQTAKDDLQAALSAAESAWARAPNKLRRKKRDLKLHKRAQKHLDHLSS